MGRAKLKMEFITEEKSRVKTFNKRKEGLMKKLKQLTILCDVPACMIIYGPVQENRAVGPDIWPQNPDAVRRIIDAAKTKDSGFGNKSYGLSDFFQERKRKVDEELTKLCKKNVEAKYPTRVKFLNFLSEAELRGFAAALSNKAQIVKSRIEFLKSKKQESNGMKMMGFAPPPNLSQFYTSLNHDQEIKPIIDMAMSFAPQNLNQNSVGNNIHCASFERQIFYNQATAAGSGRDGVENPMIFCNHTMPLTQTCYVPPLLQPVQPPSPPYTQWPVISGVAPPAQLQFSSNENLNCYDDGGEEGDIIQCLLQSFDV